MGLVRMDRAPRPRPFKNPSAPVLRAPLNDMKGSKESKKKERTKERVREKEKKRMKNIYGKSKYINYIPVIGSTKILVIPPMIPCAKNLAPKLRLASNVSEFSCCS